MIRRLAMLATIATSVFFTASAFATAPTTGDYLIKFKTQGVSMMSLPLTQARLLSMLPMGSEISEFGLDDWRRVQLPEGSIHTFNINALSKLDAIEYIQPNFKVHLLENHQLNKIQAAAAELLAKTKPTDDNCPIPIPGLCDGLGDGGGSAKDNPAIPPVPSFGNGNDPLAGSQWGMIDIGVQKAWNKSRGDRNIVVAVIDTGVDYTHEDLVENLWRNPGENGRDAQGRDKATNGIDDDNNGYVDDVIGWDFVSNDNKPYDLAVDPFQLLFGGGNPGHGTHCAGNVAARGFNGKGIAGVAPNVSIMSLRFLSEKGQGTTADAIKAIRYALDNGAHVTSNSWGSEGEDPSEDQENRALREAIAASQAKGVLFIAAAGNGHNGVGYDNDNDSKPGYPASYPDDIIISVAAIGANDALGSFSNWGKTSVDLAAPGVNVFSTTVGGNYNDKVIDFGGFTATWDGTSMATPHVAGAAALYLSSHPGAHWTEVKNAILSTVKPVTALKGKLVTGGKLNVEAL